MNDHQFKTQFTAIIPIVNYKGVLVERIIGGYKLLNQTAKSKQEVDTIINNSINSLSKSIKK